MKAILVAGGHGSRLLPMTNYTHKTLLPLCGKPIIDYALATIRNCGIKDITIIGNRFIDEIRKHVGDEVRYVLEESPKGVAAALQLACEGNEDTLALGELARNNGVDYQLLDAIQSDNAVLRKISTGKNSDVVTEDD